VVWLVKILLAVAIFPKTQLVGYIVVENDGG
jgi:hypothetical protein